MLFYLALVPAAALLYWLVRQYWRWFIGRWCRDRQFELLTFRFTRPWEPEYPFWGYRTSFRIEVRERDGTPREGCLVFGPIWAPLALEPEVTWD